LLQVELFAIFLLYFNLQYKIKNLELTWFISLFLFLLFIKYYYFQNIQYQYYSAGLLSNYDRFLEHQKLIVGNKKKKEKKPEKKIMKIKKEKINRHCTSEEYRVCIKFYVTFILTYVLYFFFMKYYMVYF